MCSFLSVCLPLTPSCCVLDCWMVINVETWYDTTHPSYRDTNWKITCCETAGVFGLNVEFNHQINHLNYFLMWLNCMVSQEWQYFSSRFVMHHRIAGVNQETGCLSYLQYGVTGGDLIVQRSNVLTLLDVWHVKNQGVYNFHYQSVSLHYFIHSPYIAQCKALRFSVWSCVGLARIKWFCLRSSGIFKQTLVLVGPAQLHYTNATKSKLVN